MWGHKHNIHLGVAVLGLLAGCAGDRGGANMSGSASGLTTVTAGATDGSGTAGTAGTGGGTDGPRFDVADGKDGGGGPGDCMGGGGMGGDIEFSYIWIANSTQGTVSKINTMTGVEEGRYWTDPSQGGGDPSRTSVNLLGDVAVSNRFPASVTKVAARPENCVDVNNNGMIDTSTGPGDIRPWGQDECVLWNVPFPGVPAQNSGARPTQWEAGEADPNGCANPNPRLWVGFRDGANVGKFVRIDGATGALLDTVDVPGTFTANWGPYGGVVNAEGDLWVDGWNSSPLIHIDAQTLQVTNYGNPGMFFYGIGIDQDGNPWVAGADGRVGVFDTVVNQFVMIPTDNSVLRGIALDREGRAWAAANGPCGLVEFDVATRTQTGTTINLPQCSTPVGVSIDAEGYVWVVDQGGFAHKVDPDTKAVVLTAMGLNGPYTYSDMTGAGLGLVSNPPAG